MSSYQAILETSCIFCLCDWEDDNDTSQRFGSIRYDHFDPIFQANVRGVIMVSEAFVEHVKASRQKKITMSSSLGTLSRPGRGAFWYAANKAAMNKINVNMAEALKGDDVIVVPLHPGAVRVEKQANDPGTHLIDTDFSVRHIIATIDELTMRESGKFTNYDGTELPW